MRIRHALVIGSAAATLALMPVAAFAAQTTPGTPGEKNCQGQTMAYLAQAAGPNGDASFLGAPGIGNVADVFGLSVQELKALVEAYCNQ